MRVPDTLTACDAALAELRTSPQSLPGRFEKAERAESNAWLEQALLLAAMDTACKRRELTKMQVHSAIPDASKRSVLRASYKFYRLCLKKSVSPVKNIEQLKALRRVKGKENQLALWRNVVSRFGTGIPKRKLTELIKQSLGADAVGCDHVTPSSHDGQIQTDQAQANLPSEGIGPAIDTLPLTASPSLPSGSWGPAAVCAGTMGDAARLTACQQSTASESSNRDADGARPMDTALSHHETIEDQGSASSREAELQLDFDGYIFSQDSIDAFLLSVDGTAFAAGGNDALFASEYASSDAAGARPRDVAHSRHGTLADALGDKQIFSPHTSDHAESTTSERHDFSGSGFYGRDVDMLDASAGEEDASSDFSGLDGGQSFYSHNPSAAPEDHVVPPSGSYHQPSEGFSGVSSSCPATGVARVISHEADQSGIDSPQEQAQDTRTDRFSLSAHPRNTASGSGSDLDVAQPSPPLISSPIKSPLVSYNHARPCADRTVCRPMSPRSRQYYADLAAFYPHANVVAPQQRLESHGSNDSSDGARLHRIAPSESLRVPRQQRSTTRTLLSQQVATDERSSTGSAASEPIERGRVSQYVQQQAAGGPQEGHLSPATPLTEDDRDEWIASLDASGPPVCTDTLTSGTPVLAAAFIPESGVADPSTSIPALSAQVLNGHAKNSILKLALLPIASDLIFNCLDAWTRSVKQELIRVCKKRVAAGRHPNFLDLMRVAAQKHARDADLKIRNDLQGTEMAQKYAPFAVELFTLVGGRGEFSSFVIELLRLARSGFSMRLHGEQQLDIVPADKLLGLLMPAPVGEDAQEPDVRQLLRTAARNATTAIDLASAKGKKFQFDVDLRRSQAPYSVTYAPLSRARGRKRAARDETSPRSTKRA